MKKTLFMLTGILVFCFECYAQNWNTFGGSSSRNGLSKITGPQNVAVSYWSVTSTHVTTLGNAVYTFGDRFITSRVNFSPYTGLIECRNLQTGAFIWSTPFISSASILYAIGFTQDGVYAHDYNTDTIYCFDPASGAIKWSGKIKSQTFGAYPGAVFDCNGDLIVNGPVPAGKSTMRLDKYTGDTLWTNTNTYSIGPAVGLVATETTVYRIEGAITSPIRLVAIDINTGANKYYSSPLPGDPDQENPITIGTDGTIYFWRDGGNLFAYKDNGSGFVQSWTYTPLSITGVALYGNITEGTDGNLYIFDTGKIRRISFINGAVLDSSMINISQGTISVGNDSTVYVNDQNGMFYALSADLQTVKWQLPVSGNHYCNPALAKEGVMVFTGAGYSITAYMPGVNIRPVSDFRAGATKAFTGQPVDFFDQSSYLPTSWQWSFPGANTTTSSQQNPMGIIYSAPGVYDVMLTATNVLGSDSVIKTCYLLVEQANAMNGTEANSQLNIYPNPANESVTINVKEALNCELKVFDVNGKEVLYRQFTSASAEISTLELKNGIYLMQLITGDKIRTRKIIIRH